MAEDPKRRQDEIAAIRAGLDLGMTLVDTAEMYANGRTEELVGEAIDGRRDEVFLVSKVLPHHAAARGVVAACEDSLRRLRTDRIDLYLLHWRGDVPLEQTLEGFASLLCSGKIRSWGVSNFDVSDMEELVARAGGSDVAANQVLYNLTRRGIEYDLLPRGRKADLPVMAYSPIEQGRLLHATALSVVARRHAGVTAAQVALAWVLRQEGVIAIPKAGAIRHVRQNLAALDIHLTQADLADLDHAYPPPPGKTPLQMI
jgi:diketogulonate reductase-like aldo/keto reductase